MLQNMLSLLCGCLCVGDIVSLCGHNAEKHLCLYVMCTHLYSTRGWGLIFTMLTVSAAHEAPSDIIPHDYTQMLMAANSCKCL